MKIFSYTLYGAFIFTVFFLTGCDNDGPSQSSGDQTVDASFAQKYWPNQSTTDAGSSQITSKVLISDLDSDGTNDSVFVSVFPHSQIKKNSILRITSDSDFTEKTNYKAHQISLLHDSTPFAYDFDKNGIKELIFVSYDLDQVFAFEFKNKLDKLFVRWSKNLPYLLEETFDRQLKEVSFNDELWIKIGPFGIKETSNKKVSVVDMGE